MKKAKLKVPAKLADELSTYLLVNEINVILCWSVDEELFSPACLIVIISFPDNQETAFKASNWFKYAIN